MGTKLAQLAVVRVAQICAHQTAMASQVIDFPAWTCHWSHITGHAEDGHTTSSTVWICERPYRTILYSPPDDCEGCPMRENHKARTPRKPDGGPELAHAS
jgi:hypothetical protein